MRHCCGAFRLPPPNFAIAALRDPEFVMAYGSEVLFAHNSCRTTAQGPSMIPVCLMCHAVPSEFCEDTLTVPLQEWPLWITTGQCRITPKIPQSANVNWFDFIVLLHHVTSVLTWLRYISLYERPTQDGHSRLPPHPLKVHWLWRSWTRNNCWCSRLILSKKPASLGCASANTTAPCWWGLPHRFGHMMCMSCCHLAPLSTGVIGVHSSSCWKFQKMKTLSQGPVSRLHWCSRSLVWFLTLALEILCAGCHCRDLPLFFCFLLTVLEANFLVSFLPLDALVLPAHQVCARFFQLSSVRTRWGFASICNPRMHGRLSTVKPPQCTTMLKRAFMIQLS